MTVGHPMDAWFLTNEDSSVKAAMFGYFGSGNPWNVQSLLAFDATLGRLGISCDWVLAGTICRVGLKLKSMPFDFGVVDAPEDFYRHVDCCINPMTGGTGLKIKTIEALAYGRPVIGSESAFEGLDVRHAMHRISNMDELAHATVDYKQSADARRELHIESRRLFARYSETTRQQFDRLSDRIRKQA
jgi:hypothetical protein